MLLAQVIIDAQLPVVGLIQTLDSPEQGWLHLFGTRRCNTLKNRFKAWRPFAVWLELHYGRKFPILLKDIIDYVQFRVNEGCGKSIPECFHVSLCLIEQLGRVPEGERFSSEELWKSHVRAWTAELASESPPVRPAEMYTVAMLISMELMIADESQPLFSRALAWVVLVMVWGSMRCDDMQSALPHRTTLSNFGLRMVLGKTKTSGPDKVQKEVSAHVYRTVSLTGEDWLSIGYRIWDRDPFNSRRDYFVMEPTSDLVICEKEVCFACFTEFSHHEAFERLVGAETSHWWLGHQHWFIVVTGWVGDTLYRSQSEEFYDLGCSCDWIPSGSTGLSGSMGNGNGCI